MTRWRHPNQREQQSLPAELRRVTLTARTRAWVEAGAGSRIRRVRRLPGASSTAVHAVTLASGDVLVLRTYVWSGFLSDEPDAPRREVDALRWAADAGLPVPEVVAADPVGAEAGVPAVLMTRIPGRAEGQPPSLDRLAALAAEIHGVDAAPFPHDWFPWCRETSTRPPAGARDRRAWERAHELWRAGPPDYRPSFIHRDFHPGNVLWQRGAPTGVVDWANACEGPPGLDIATCRWNLARWADSAAADAFVAAYERLTGTTHDPYWDLARLLEDDWDLGKPAAEVRHAEDQLVSTLARLG